MTRYIDGAVRNAVRSLVNSCAGGQSEVARLCGIAQKQISNYISGKTHRMTSSSWERLYPHLKPFLSADAVVRIESGAVADGHELLSRRRMVRAVLGDAQLTPEAKLRVLELIEDILEK